MIIYFNLIKLYPIVAIISIILRISSERNVIWRMERSQTIISSKTKEIIKYDIKIINIIYDMIYNPNIATKSTIESSPYPRSQRSRPRQIPIADRALFRKQLVMDVGRDALMDANLDSSKTTNGYMDALRCFDEALHCKRRYGIPLTP